jgi:hypothetical protein
VPSTTSQRWRLHPLLSRELSVSMMARAGSGLNIAGSGWTRASHFRLGHFLDLDAYLVNSGTEF